MTPITKIMAIKPMENLVKNWPLTLSNKKKIMPKQIIPMMYIVIKAVLTSASEIAIRSPHQPLYLTEKVGERMGVGYSIINW